MRDYRFGKEPNNMNKGGTPIIYRPLKLSLDSFSVLLLSYSIRCYHLVLVTTNSSLKGVGNNQNGRICRNLQKSIIKDFTDFCIKDKNGCQLAAVWSFCSQYDTL